MNIIACIEFAVPFSSVPCMASTTKLVSFHPRILLFSVLFVVTASDANFSRLVVVGGHHDLSVSDDRGICPRTRASIVLCNVFAATACCFGRQPPQTPGIVPSVTACRLEAACTHEEEEDDEDRMMLFGRRPPPRPQSREEDAALHLPMDRGSRHLHALPGQIFAERPSPVVNSVVDRTRTGLLWSNRSPSVCRKKPSVIISSSPTPSHSIDLIVYSSGSEEQLSAHGNMDRMYCSDLVELEEDEYLLDEPCTGLDHPWPYDLSDDDIPCGISPLVKWKAEELSGSNRDPPRRMLPGKAGPVSASHIAPTKRPHVAIHHQLRWTRRLQASVATGGLALLGLICAVAAGLLHCCTRRKRLRRQSAAMAVELGEFEDNNPEQFRGLTWPRRFLYSEMAAATGDFAEDTKIGRGGFGPVYRGSLTEEDRHVAIKVLTAGEQSRQGMREFQAEVTVMSQLRHRNIVQLLGWCDCRRGLLLVYEFMPEGSLDKHLYDTDRLLSWPDRYNIALGLGSALQYLHQDCDRCVVHGDIKPANVMLDASRNAKLGDFGLARLVDHGAEPQTTQVVAGTVGYIDPEFVDSRRPSNESDVYSFGVVLLEIACGRRPTSSSRRPDGAPALLCFVRGMYDRGTVLDAADERLNGVFDERQMDRVLVTGLWCACHDASRRPSVVQAVEALRAVGAELPVLAPARIGAERSLLELRAYGDLSVEFCTAHATAYLTSSDSSYLLAAEE